MSHSYNYSVMLACPASFFTIPNKSEGFQTSWNDSQCGLTYEFLSNCRQYKNHDTGCLKQDTFRTIIDLNPLSFRDC